MSASETSHPNYVTIWAWLIALLAAGLLLIAVPLSKAMVIVLIFSIATVKAILVVRHYMHLKAQPLAVYAILAVPLLFVIGMTIALLPDIAFRP